MRSVGAPKKSTIIFIFFILLVNAFVFGPRLLSPSLSGAYLGSRNLLLTNYNTSATSNYKAGFNHITNGNVGSIKLEFCANDPIIGNSCTAPNGFDASSAQISAQTGTTGFTISGTSNANTIILTRNSAPVNLGAASYSFDGIKNPTQSGTYYLRIQTFSSNNATGNSSDYGGIAYSILNDLTITATVPPYLIFCTGVTITNLDCANASGNLVDFGELSTNTARKGSSQMLIASNAELGYSVTVQGTTLTSGNNEITALLANDISRPGTSQFGLNLRSNSAPAVGSDVTGPGTAQPSANYAQANFFRFVSGETLVSTPGTSDVRLFTVSYIANINGAQPAGIYVSTLTYICLANF